MSQVAIPNTQSSLGLTVFVWQDGIFPVPGGTVGSDNFIGEIGIFAGNYDPFGELAANGSAISPSSNAPLLDVVGTTFSVSNANPFVLPNLVGTAMIGAGNGPGEGEGNATGGSSTTTLSYQEQPPDLGGTSQSFDNYQPSLSIEYIIDINGVFASSTGSDTNSPFVGEVVPFAGANVPSGWALCNGQLLSVNQNGGLFSILGFAYGGNDTTTFALPDLSGRDIVGASFLDQVGQQFGQASVSLSNSQAPVPPATSAAASFDNQQPSLVLNYIIALDGVYPSRSGPGNVSNEVYIGEIVAFAGAFVPGGWALCNGQLLSIAQNEGLFSEIDFTYGGNGTTTFALPNLDDRTVLGTGNNVSLGETLGANSEVINASELPPPCYCRGTLIEAARGQQRVETLQIGDKVRTASGALRPIKWIGRRSYAGRFVLGRKDMLPICIKSGALGDNVPARDLWVSPNHAMYFGVGWMSQTTSESSLRAQRSNPEGAPVAQSNPDRRTGLLRRFAPRNDELDGVLIEAKDLVNGVSIVQAAHVDTVEYFHIELDTHDVIIAEGALAESFIDDDSRAMFHNAHDYATLYADEVARPACYCAPRLDEGYEVEAARQRIALRAGLMRADAPETGALRGYVDLVSPTCITGWAQNADHPEAPVCLDIFSGGRLIGQTLANNYREGLQRAGLGSGRHSFSFTPPAGLDFAADTVQVRRSLDAAAVKFSAISRRAVQQLAAGMISLGAGR